MHHSPVGTDGLAPELLERIGGLAEPAQREEAAAALARLLGGERLLLFAPDPELGVLLPAPGLSQLLRRAGEWRSFLEACAREGEYSGSIPGSDGGAVPALGCALADGTAAVLVEPGPGAAGPGCLLPLLPLLGALFRAERQVGADEVRARAAADAIERAKVLNRGLQEMRQRLQDALAEAEEARAEARERAEQAESARAAADEANRAKTDFLAAMSHELRTPLNAVAGYVDLIDAEIYGPITVAQKQALERVRRSQEYLLMLINDVLHFAKLEAGRLEFSIRDFPLCEVLEGVASAVEPLAGARGITYAGDPCDAALFVRGDPDRVRQVLLNLVGNALKFTPPGGRVAIHCEPTPERVHVRVQDTGRGIPADRLEVIFDPFVQLDRNRHEVSQQGVGLGLAISRDLARGMGGNLMAESVEGGGSTLTLTLPRSGRAAP